MKIKWKTIEKADYRTIESWLGEQDKINLCMQTKNWEQTATDIGECLELMDNAQFKNLIGFINDKPVVAVMFGIEQIKAPFGLWSWNPSSSAMFRKSALDILNFYPNKEYWKTGADKVIFSLLDLVLYLS